MPEKDPAEISIGDVGDDDDSTGVFDVGIPAPRAQAGDHSRIIGERYEIVDRIGEGGMGQVLKVRHRRLGKAFALKLMRAEHSVDENAREIFNREARLASALSHPNIVSIVDFGEDPDWGMFIVMEFIDGDVLADRIEGESPISIPTVCDVVRQLADALQHSHDNTVIHGDLKSENVLCLHDDRRRWNVKLLDFGTAQVETALPREDDTIAGTPEYMAPERITGGAPRASNDIYALGIILFELLAGRVPFYDDSPTEILRMHLMERLPSVAAVRGESVDQALLDIVERALDRDPEKRFASAGELSTELTAYMEELGLRIRRRRPSTETASRSTAAADAFQHLGIPACSLDPNGTIIVANSKFARLWGYAGSSELEGTNILHTPLGKLHDLLREDIRLVAMDGKVARRRVKVKRSGKALVLRLLLTPSGGVISSCVMLIHPLSGKPG